MSEGVAEQPGLDPASQTWHLLVKGMEIIHMRV